MVQCSYCHKMKKENKVYLLRSPKGEQRFFCDEICLKIWLRSKEPWIR